MKTLPLLAASLLCIVIFTSISRAQDIRAFELDRYEYFSQCTTNPAPLNTARGHFLTAFAIGNYSGAVLSGLLERAPASWPLTNTGSELHGRVELTAAASPGAYFFTVTTATEGIVSRAVALPGVAKKIAPARIANFIEAQKVDATQPFTLQWDPIKGTGPRDFLRLRVYNSAEELLVDNQLSKDDTSFEIPASTLAPGTTNVAYLFILHLLSLHPARPGVPGSVAVEYRVTKFVVRTRHPEGQLFFGSHRLFAYETNGVIDIPVNRTAGEGQVTVDYFTENVTAQAGVNYVATNGTLVFEAGVTNQIITVPLLDDGQASGPLIARVRLTNATGGLLLPVRTALDWSILDGQTDPGQNINAVLLSKVSFFFQTNDNLGDQSTRCIPSRFFASVHPAFPGGVRDALLHLPRKSTRTLNVFEGTFLEHNEDFPTRALTDKQFPAGPYTVDFNTLLQGHFTESLRMVAEPSFPVPHVTNWTAARALDSTAPFTLQWEAFAGAASNDYVRVGVYDDNQILVLETPSSFEPGALPGTTTSLEIPANTFLSSARYLVNLIFSKTARYSVDAASGAKNCTIFAHTTDFYIHTQTNEAMLVHSPRVLVTSAPDCCGVNTHVTDASLGELLSSQKFSRVK